MNKIVRQNAPNPMAQFKRELAAVATEMHTGDIPVEKMKSAIVIAVQKDPDLLRSDRASLWRAARSAAADGLLPDGREAAFVRFGGEVQYMPMVFGAIKRVRNSGEIRSIRAAVVFEHDVFRVEYDDDDHAKIVHEFGWFASDQDRGRPLGAYAVAKMRDGWVEFKTLSAADIEKRRRVSRGQKDRPSGPWATWWKEMWEKSAIHALVKRLPVSSENMAVLANDAAAAIEDRPAPRPGGAIVEHEPAPEEFAQDAETVDATTGEIINAEPAQEPAPSKDDDKQTTDANDPPDHIASLLGRIANDIADAAGDKVMIDNIMEMFAQEVSAVRAAGFGDRIDAIVAEAKEATS